MSTVTSTWDEDPDGASLLVATGRARHDLLVVAEPALLSAVDQAWGPPDSRVHLSFLPGVSAPGTAGQEDDLASYERGGLGVLVARGRTTAYEGGPLGSTTALARIAAGAGVRAALFVSRASALSEAAPGDVLAVRDHVNLSGSPLFLATAPLDAAWDALVAGRVTQVEGVRGAGVVALVPGPTRPTPAEAVALARLGADAVVMDSVAEAMVLASRGVRVSGLAYIDRVADVAVRGRRHAAAGETPSVRRPVPDVVLAAIEAVLAEIA